MGAFCVYGVTMDKAKEKAMKKVRAVVAGRIKSLDELEAERMQEAEKLFEKMAPVQISPEFDAPQFCSEWLEVAVKSIQIRNAVVMARSEKKDKKGRPMLSKKTQQPIIGWVKYDMQQLKVAA